MVARLLWQVHAGVLDHHDSLWDTRPGKRGHAVRQRGMSEWLAEMISLAASREPPRRLLFIGLSFGAALAQLTGTGRVAPVHTAAVITAPVLHIRITLHRAVSMLHRSTSVLIA